MKSGNADRRAVRSGLELDSRTLGNRVHVLVATSGKVHEQNLVLGQGRCELCRMRKGMRGLERRDDAFEAAQIVEGLKRLAVRHRDILGT